MRNPHAKIDLFTSVLIGHGTALHGIMQQPRRLRTLPIGNYGYFLQR